MKLKLVPRKGGKFDELIDSFLSLRAKSTARIYDYKYKLFCDFLGCDWRTEEARNELVSVDKQIAVNFIKWYSERTGQKAHLDNSKEMSPRTIKQTIMALRVLYDHLIDIGVYKGDNPFPKSIHKAFRSNAFKRATKMIPYEYVNTLIDYPYGLDRKGIQDRAIICLLFGSGLRASEAANIRIGNIYERDGGYGIEQVRTKGGGSVSHALPEFCTEPIKAQLEARLANGKGYADKLFKMTVPTLQRRFKKYVKLVGLNPDHYSVHSTRATSITKLLDLGDSYREVCKFSGHKSVAMVEYYDKRRRGNVEIGKKLKF